MALAAIQASYDDEDDIDLQKNKINRTTTDEDDAYDRMAVINDPEFSVMSKIKLNLTPAIAVRVRSILI
jgi:hypothetical protein